MPQPTEFFSKEYTLKLYRELGDAGTETKVQFTLDYIDTVRADYPLEIVEYMTKTQLATIYFDQEEYKKALPILEEINAQEAPKDTAGKHLYLLLLIRTNRLLGNFPSALTLLEQNLLSEKRKESGFETLNFLKEYADLCQTAEWEFDAKFTAVLDQVVEDLGFEDKDLNPLDKIHFLSQTNREWNVRLGKLMVKEGISPQEKMELLENFIEDCPVGWYEKHARNLVQQLKSE